MGRRLAKNSPRWVLGAPSNRYKKVRLSPRRLGQVVTPRRTAACCNQHEAAPRTSNIFARPAGQALKTPLAHRHSRHSYGENFAKRLNIPNPLFSIVGDASMCDD